MDEISMSPLNSRYSTWSSADMADDSALTGVSTIENHHQFSLPSSVLEGGINDELYDQLKKSMEEAENSKREAFDELMRRCRAEKDAIAAIRRAKSSENLYAEELRRRKEVEEALARGKQELEKMKQQVNVLSKLRHSNLVALIGAFPESFILVYEYLPNGSLEDRLCCKDGSPSLSWQTRIRIAMELCSAVIYLHSCNPSSIVHGDLKPGNILLYSDYVSKLSDFGICCILNQNEFLSNNTAVCCITNPKCTFTYMDPSFLATGELTPKLDVYSFGIILLRY